MKAQHTPGPLSYADGHIFKANKEREYNSIATVHDIYDNDDNAESNAALIAAAETAAERDRLKKALSSMSHKISDHLQNILSSSNVLNTAENADCVAEIKRSIIEIRLILDND